VVRELEVPAYREIGLAMNDKKSASLAVKRLLDYLQYRNSFENGASQPGRPDA
jgi:hypothetical protein